MNFPDTWQKVKLEDICDISIGRTPARDNPSYWGNGLPWLSIGDMRQGRAINSTKETITERAVSECNCKIIESETLLLSFKLSIGKVGFNKVPLYTNEAIAALPIKRSDLVDKTYLFWTLQFIDLERNIDKAAKGKTLNKAKLKEVEIPLPPLPQQRRIAAILDKADALREKRRQAIAKLDTLLQSVFLEMFGDPMKNQKGWPWGKISDLCKDIVDCPHSTPTYAVTATAYACWRSSDIQNGYIDKTATKYVYLEEYNQRIQRTPPKKGDVIYCREGARFGNAARILDDEKSCLGQRMMLMRAAPSKGTPEYLWAFLNAKSTYQKMVSLVGGSASPHVNVKEIKHFAAPIPPFQLQEKFSMLVHLIDQMRERSHMSLDMLESLFSSLQQRAFTGQLFTEKSAAAAQQELFAGS